MTTPNVSDILKKARALLSDEKKWTTGFYARDNEGNFVYASDDQAVCFCAIGAVKKVMIDEGLGDVCLEGLAVTQLDIVTQKLFQIECVSQLNDFRDYGYNSVLHVFDAAIKEAS